MNEAFYQVLVQRFGAIGAQPVSGEVPAAWREMAGRGSCRRFRDQAVPPDLIDTLCALALCAPTKSDLQQRDIIVIEDAELRAALERHLTEGPLGQAWISKAPRLLVFCGNNRRQRQIHEWRQRENANDHFDALFNAAVDAAVALSAFIAAAEAAGLGCCPISAIRNQAEEVSALLALPPHVFPVAGLAVGYPDQAQPKVSLRLPLSATVHRDRYQESNLRTAVDDYDRRREAAQPYETQRYVETFGEVEHYGWSEDKARQYAKPERAGFGRYLRAQGFVLD